MVGPNSTQVIAEAKEHVTQELPHEDHPLITKSQSDMLQDDEDYFIYPIYSNYDSPHKLVTGLKRYKSLHPDAKTYPSYLQRAIQFHKKHNLKLSTTVKGCSG
ncbi:unnamed protein product [Cuscuta epithymum]|uniref:Uncharacterized protein n=1 Tax=Cuscuta epithymum TaxID=186058 RepID=A0AAV0G362_9ASTE|nr:unnamed protein product [Cuscuta epithymum]